MRIFSLRRAALSVVLGFLTPLGYAFALHLADEYAGVKPTEMMLMPFAWPRPLWIFLMGRQPTEADIVPGLLFVAAANILLYGSLIYAALTLLPLLRRSRTDFGPPPPPEPLRGQEAAARGGREGIEP